MNVAVAVSKQLRGGWLKSLGMISHPDGELGWTKDLSISIGDVSTMS